MMTVAHILACIIFGALWRVLKGGTLRAGTAPLAAITFVPACALSIAPLLAWGLR